jgi:Lon protease-like protein
MIEPPKAPVPIFPLPNFVLFPHTVVPLHIFELRYRAMVRDALSGERLIAMAMLKPGWERDYHGSPEFYRLGCLARFEDVRWLPDDCYDLKLLGVSRVRFERPVREYPYRAAPVRILPCDPLTEDDPLVQIERRALLDVCARWANAEARAGEVRPTPPFGEGLTYEALVNAVCMGLAVNARRKLELLALDSVIDRGHRVRDMVERRLREGPKEPDPRGGELN